MAATFSRHSKTSGSCAAGDRVTPAYDEAWRPVDAQPMGAEIVPMDMLHRLVAQQEGARRRGLQPALPADRHQHVEAADVEAVGEIGGENRIRHHLRPAEAGSEANQTMRVDAARRAADPVEAEQDAFAAPDLGDG